MAEEGASMKVEEAVEGKEEGVGVEGMQTQPPGTLEKPKLDWYFNEIFQIPNFHQFLSKRDVKNLRRVCQDWSVSIDNVLDTANDFKEPNYSNYKSIISSPLMLAFDTNTKHGLHHPLVLHPRLVHSNDVSRFWSGAKSHRRNPFLSRRAYFCCLIDDEQYFWRQAKAVLERYGEELRYMNIWFQSLLPRADMFRIVQECISLTPQLIYLEMYLINGFPEADEPSGLVIPEFPPLPNLTRLSVNFRRCSIFQSVYFEQLVSLNVREEENFMDLYDPELHSTFPSLKHLGVAIKTEIALFKLHSLTSQLREVDIRGIHSENFCPSIYFWFLEHFKDTLCVVKIEKRIRCDENLLFTADLGLTDRPKLDLPRLKVLCLAVKNCGFGGLDDILRLSNPPDYLELKVFHCPCDVEDYEGPEIIQTHPYLEDMYRSNIWELVPSLQEMVIEHDHLLQDLTLSNRDRYTRHMYEVTKQQLEAEDSPRPVKRVRYGI